jgi:putative redox protein
MTAAAVERDLDAVTIAETGVGRFQVEVMAGGATFLADEPADAGGLGSGPNPYDLLASALGACTAMTLRLYASRKGWPLERAIVRVLHTRSGLQARDRFAREITLEGPLDAGQQRRLLEIAERCPVHRSLERGSDIVSVLAQPPVFDAMQATGEGHMRDMVDACCD